MPPQFTSTVALLFANLLPIAGVLLWDWEVRSILTLYWSENLILGTIMLLKMLHLKRLKALPTMLFFLIHYGVFCFAHGTIISEIFVPLNLDLASADESFAGPVGRIFFDASQLWWWAFAALAMSHLLSFVVNWLGQGEYRGQKMSDLMSAPYKRIMILHITVLMGGLAITKLGGPVYLLVVLVVAKILVDISMHRREHRAQGRSLAIDSEDV